jgi:hypothetical protein
VICLATDPAGIPVTCESGARAATAHGNHEGKPSGLTDRPHGASSWPASSPVICEHAPPCPAADAPGREAARVIAFHPDQGWSLLCNGIVAFDDTGALLPDGTVLQTPRAAGGSPADGLRPNDASYRHHDHYGVPDLDLVAFLQPLVCVDAESVERRTVG